MTTADADTNYERRSKKPPVSRLLFAVAFVVASIALIWMAATFTTLPSGLRTTFLLAPWALLFVALVRAMAKGVPYHFTNHTLPERVGNLADMLSRARHSVLIITGSLDSGLYNHKRVLAAVRALPGHVKITLIHTSAKLDPKSEALLAELQRRKVKPRYVPSGILRHAVVVDKRDSKIEQAGVADDAEEKCADYYYSDRGVAKRLLREIDALNIEGAKVR